MSLLLDELDTLGGELDRAALATTGAATYCSGSDWALSAARELHPARTPFVFRDGESWVALTLGPHEQVGALLQPLEADWGFTCPLPGPDPAVAVDLLDARLAASDAWRAVLLAGLPERLARLAATRLRKRYRVMARPGIRCQIGDITGGAEAFLARRSPGFRANLRRDRRRAERDGVTFQAVAGDADAHAVFERIRAVERTTWKFQSGQGVLGVARYASFYEAVLARASRRGALRAVFAQRDGTDVAYVFGGVLGDTYRGFQLGYDEREGRLGLGNLVQLAMIESLASQGIARYDLGMEMPYKVRWADDVLALSTVIAWNRS